MKQIYSQKETIEIIKRALNAKDMEAENTGSLIAFNDLEKMATECISCN